MSLDEVIFAEENGVGIITLNSYQIFIKDYKRLSNFGNFFLEDSRL